MKIPIQCQSIRVQGPGKFLCLVLDKVDLLVQMSCTVAELDKPSRPRGSMDSAESMAALSEVAV